MELALTQARLAGLRGEVPVGAVVLDSHGSPLGVAGNQTELDHDSAAHAEMLALRRAASVRGSTRLPDCDLVVTLEPCPMCAAAIGLFRIRRLYFGAYDPKGGGVEHGPRIYENGFPHRPREIIGGIQEQASQALLQTFFQMLRKEAFELTGDQQVAAWGSQCGNGARRR